MFRPTRHHNTWHVAFGPEQRTQCSHIVQHKELCERLICETRLLDRRTGARARAASSSGKAASPTTCTANGTRTAPEGNGPNSLTSLTGLTSRTRLALGAGVGGEGGERAPSAAQTPALRCRPPRNPQKTRVRTRGGAYSSRLAAHEAGLTRSPRQCII